MARMTMLDGVQVLPLVEAFFVLCEAQLAALPPPTPGALRAVSSDLGRVTSTDMLQSTQPSTPAAPPRTIGGAVDKDVVEAHLPFLRCAVLFTM